MAGKQKILIDKWISGINHPHLPINDLHRFYQDVAELIIPETSNWNIPLLDQLFDANASRRIHNMFLDTAKEDVMIWTPAKDDRSGSSSSTQPYPSTKRKRLVSKSSRIPEPCDDSLVRIIRVKKIIPRYPSGTCVTVVDDDDLTTPLPSSSNTPAADLEYADLGISSYEYPNASLPFYVHMRCLSSSYRAVGGFLVRKEFVPLNTKI
ncbi:hypothetical protein C5167_022953 [Papaver somniferum]|uniref:Uncharacterized protein n=1 Tax=Papaver somniferum TaxID=3469 RepID=A0A4Y7JN91_PAPSO|nr:hypothetical protein C5167_022953 [Papaver somniferum]